MRRAWSSGYQAKTRGELADVAEAAFALVLRHQQLPFSVEKGGEGAPATAWGAHAGAPKGPALLPHLHSLRGATGTGSNAALYVPHPGRCAANACALCVAQRGPAVGRRCRRRGGEGQPLPLACGWALGERGPLRTAGEVRVRKLTEEA